MNEFYKMRTLFFHIIEENCFGESKKKAYSHSIQVCTIAQMLALQRHLDLEIASIIGLMHDIGAYIYHSSFHHGERGANYLRNYLTHPHSEIIFTAIINHSDKQHIHDEYSELLKDADVLAQYLEEPDCLFNQYKEERLKKVLDKEKNVT